MHPNSAVQVQSLPRWHADPIIADGKFETVRSPFQFDGHAGRMRVAMHVNERFLRYPEQSHCRRPVVPRLLANHLGRFIPGHDAQAAKKS